jgi:hypothetical protein
MATKVKFPKAPAGIGLGSLPAPKAPKPLAMPVPANPMKGITGNNPTPIQPTAQPIDPNVLNAQLIGNRNVAIGTGEAAYQQGNLGFDAGYNPDGTVNTANPYSRAALLQLGYEDSRRGTTNSLAAQGQLYSGAMLNAQARNDFTYGANEAANRLGYQRGLHGIQTGQLNTAANAGTGVSDADFAALLRATYPGS